MDDPLGKLDDAAQRLENAAKSLGAARVSGNTSTVTLNAGGVGVWACVTSCIVMLVLNLVLLAVLAFKMNEYDNEIQTATDYAQAAYRGAAYQRGISDEQTNHSGPDSTPASPASGSAESPDP